LSGVTARDSRLYHVHSTVDVGIPSDVAMTSGETERCDAVRYRITPNTNAISVDGDDADAAGGDRNELNSAICLERASGVSLAASHAVTLSTAHARPSRLSNRAPRGNCDDMIGVVVERYLRKCLPDVGNISRRDISHWPLV